MPNSKAGRFRIATDLNPGIRSNLLRLYKPSFELVWCQSITWAYDVPADFSFPQGDLDALVYGIHRGEKSEALIVQIAGNYYRRDPMLALTGQFQNLAVTLSTQEGVASQWACQQASDGFTPLEEDQQVRFRCRLQQFPVWQKQRPLAVA